jgi:hypothetical protein
LGLVLHTGATIWLLLDVVTPLKGDRRAWTPGMLHLVTSYVWLLGPVLLAPLIVLRAPGFPVGEVAGNGAPMLIYGWILQFGYALIPYLFRRVFLPHAPARLGGAWFSLIAAHLGGVFLWAGLFSPYGQSFLHGAAFALWVLSMIPILADLWRIVRAGMSRADPATHRSLP